MKTLILIFTIIFYSFSYGQTTSELFDNKNFQELIKLENKADLLTPDELFMVGFAFFQLEKDVKAIEFYDKAINKGLDSDYVHYNKALSLRYSKKYDEAIKEFDIAINKAPTNQMYLSEKGFLYYYSGNYDKALSVFIEAQKLPNDFEAPFYMVPHIYHINKQFDKALIGFYEALIHISKDNKYYISTLSDIGKIEYSVNKDYSKSAKAYSQAININPKNYDFYPKLIKAFNAMKEYSIADSLFGLMKIAFKNNELSEDDMQFKNIEFAQDELNGQIISIYKYLIDPKESLDIFYKVFLLRKEGDKVERTFMVEKTIQIKDGPKYLVCEKNKKTNTHLTYLYGWKTDNIPLDDLKKAIGLILDGKLKPGASTTFGNK